MKYEQLLGCIALIGLCFITCLGCGSAGNSSTETTQTANAKHEPASSSKQLPQAEISEAAQVNFGNGTSAASAVATNQLATNSAAPQRAKPTAEQLQRWKYAEFTPLQLLAFLENDKAGFVSFVAATSNGQQYLLGGTKLTLWNINDHRLVQEFIEARTGDDERLLSFAYSPIGNWCVAGSASGQLRTFDIETLQELSSTPQSPKKIAVLAISPDGKEIATVPFSAEITIWNAETLQKKNSFKLDTHDVKRLLYVAPQTLLAAGETMSTWDSSSGKQLKTFASAKYQTAIALSPDGKELVFGADQCLQRWNWIDDQANGEYRGVPTRNSVIRFSPDGSLLAVASGEAVRILDATTGQLLQVIDAAGSMISDIAWIPQKQLLLIATEMGSLRIWGRPDEGQDLGLGKPSVANVLTKMTPASVAENLALIDLRVLPKLPGSIPQFDDFNVLNYAAPVNPDEVTLFYRHILSERGWQEMSEQAAQSSLAFQKNGSSLNISFYSDKPDQTHINLTLLGNYDIRQTPKLTEFLKEIVYEGTTSIIYKVSATLLQIETELLQKLHQQGWTAVVRLNRSTNEEPDGRFFEFVKNGSLLNVMVQRDVVDKTLYIINYSQSLSLHSLPVPPDAGLMEWDNHHETQLVASTALGLQAATAFYEEAMKNQGWTPRAAGRRVDKDFVYLPYYWGQRDVTIALSPISDGLVRIWAGKYSSHSWQQPETTKSATDQSQTEAGVPVKDCIQAADIPILHANGAATYQAADGKIHFELEKISLIELAKEYEAALNELGWTAKAVGKPQETSVVIHFEKGGNTIHYQSAIDPRGIGTVDFSGAGLTWTKAVPIRQLISFGAWLRNKKLPTSLMRLGEYKAEMEMLTK
jgi:WD40 repeat protein